MIADPRLGELLALQQQLIAATSAWSQGASPDPQTAALRRRAIEINHLRYTERIPVYQQLAADQDLLAEADLDAIVNELTFTDEVFKSYQVEWLQQGDFAAMTAWLEGIFSHPVSLDCRDIADLGTWRDRLRTAGVMVTYSSGTSGRMSFVPRDPITWRALRRNAQSYTDFAWWEDDQGQRQPFDCLIAGPRGDGMGIQGAGAGLAHMAARSHYLFDRALTADDVQALTGGGSPPPGTGPAGRTLPAQERVAYGQAREFLARAAEQQRPVLVFGTPFQVCRLCEQLLQLGPPLAAHPRSIVATGGGWKSFSDQRIPQAELRQLIGRALGIAAGRCLDAYSTSELNCTLISCPAMRYHVPPLVEPVVLDESGCGAAGRPGTGTLTFLDPFAMSYPGFFITGDVATLRHGPCECGRHGWFVEGEIWRPAGREIKGCGGVLAATIA